MSSTVPAPQFSYQSRRFQDIRSQSETLAAPLSAEDACVQSMPDASPAKWHLAHTTWFFETFVLAPNVHDYAVFDNTFRFLFNSYYNAVGEQYSRPHRGLLTRPALDTIIAYRACVDEHMIRLFEDGVGDDVAAVIEVGLHHEQQHQELLLMDIKHLFSCNPTMPAYVSVKPFDSSAASEQQFVRFEGGICPIGATDDCFSFDNERPRHDTLLHDFGFASRLVTNRDYLEFIDDGGYDSPLLWLSDGWATLRAQSWRAPLYWRDGDDEWFEFSLSGQHKLVLDAPVTHVSYYEADAYARWSGARLPTEAEWERVASGVDPTGNFVEQGRFHPCPAQSHDRDRSPGINQLFGDVWEWTASAYSAYPGFKTPAGAIGEYNGKFMSGQMVLRGGCCATPRDHIRASYRNFFYPANRWQFGGIRLAQD